MYDNGKMLKSMKWGNIGNNPQLSTINARAEGITSSPMWGKLLPTNRCAVVASGYFEWQTTGGKKQPHYLHFKDRPLIVMAGLYEEQLEENESESVFHYAIITTANAKDIGWLHDRMPVILDSDEKIDLWINGDYATQRTEILSLMKPYEGLECYAVPEIVNSNRNDTSDCIRKYEDFKKTGGIAAFFQGPKKEISDVDKSENSPKKEGKGGKKVEPKKKKDITAFFEPKGKDEKETEKEAEEDKEEKEKEEEEEKDAQGIDDAIKEEIKKELKEEIKAELKEELKQEIKNEAAAAKDKEDAQKEAVEEEEDAGSKKKGAKRKKPATVTKEKGAKKGKSNKK